MRDTVNKRWDQIGSQITEDRLGQAFFYEAEETYERAYGSVYQSKKSYQLCAALATLYHTRDGEEEDTPNHTGGNGAYWALKEAGQPLEMWSGFRVWSDSSQSSTIAQADTAMFQYQLHDFADDGPLIKAEPKQEETET